jgi:hypothetical protein
VNLAELLPCEWCGGMPRAIDGTCTCPPKTVEPPTIPILRPVVIPAPAPKPQPKPKPTGPHLPATTRLDLNAANRLVAKLLGRTPA